MMDDLRRRFASLDEVAVPDLEAEIGRRAVASARRPATSAVPGSTVRSGTAARVAWGPRFGGVPVLIVVALLVVALIATLALGADLSRRLTVSLPSSPPPAQPSDNASPFQSTASRLGVVAYKRDGRVWVANVDGTGARQLVPQDLDPVKPRLPDGPDRQFPIAWSPDGSRLYYWFARTASRGPNDGIGEPHSGVAVTDVAGSPPIELLELAGKAPDGGFCPPPIEADNCQANIDDLALSRDGTRFAYDIQEGRNLHISTVVVLDIASGQRRRLEATRTENPAIEGRPSCSEAFKGYNRQVRWSPDGSRLLFTRDYCGGGLFTISADGTDLREISRPEAFTQVSRPAWSPDGSTILFHAGKDRADPGRTLDIYTVRPDGTGLHALTGDGNSVWPFWTTDSRVVFIRWAPEGRGQGHLWVMDADGDNQLLLDATLPALTAAGCAVCPFPIGDVGEPGEPNQLIGGFEDPSGSGGGRLDLWLWQPVPGDQQ
jgi:Tol biopolymer transport system component